jgi:hypothetical protein
MLEDRSGEEVFFPVMGSSDLWREFKKYIYPGKNK